MNVNPNGGKPKWNFEYAFILGNPISYGECQIPLMPMGIIPFTLLTTNLGFTSAFQTNVPQMG